MGEYGRRGEGGHDGTDVDSPFPGEEWGRGGARLFQGGKCHLQPPPSKIVPISGFSE